MLEHRIGDITVFSYAALGEYENVTNVIVTRLGGSSPPPYAALNLGLHAGDDDEAVLANRERLGRALGFDPERIVTGRQVHETRVRRVTEKDAGRGAIRWEEGFARTDALITDVPDVPLMVLVADCAPLSFFDPEHGVIGVAHAGWRGTLAGIAGTVVRELEKAFGTRPENLFAGIGPAIGKCHYEVGQGVYDAFKKAFGREVDDYFPEDMHGTLYLDLWSANRARLREAGVRDDHMTASGMCTACHPDLFFSHRGEAGQTGRFGGIIMLHKETRRAY